MVMTYFSLNILSSEKEGLMARSHPFPLSHLFVETWAHHQGPCAIWDIRPKITFNSNFKITCSSITSVSLSKSFCNFAQSIAVILPNSVQNHKTTGWLWNKLWAYRFSQHLDLRCVSSAAMVLTSFPENIVRPRWLKEPYVLCIIIYNEIGIK